MDYKGTSTLTVEQLAEWDKEQLELANQVLGQEADAIRLERKKINAALSLQAVREKVGTLNDAERAITLHVLGIPSAEEFGKP